MQRKKLIIILNTIAFLAIINYQVVGPVVANLTTELDFEIFVENRVYDVEDEVIVNVYDLQTNFNYFIWSFHDGSNSITTSASTRTQTHIFNSEGEFLISVMGMKVNNAGYAIYKLKKTTINVRNNPPIVTLEADSNSIWEDTSVRFFVDSIEDSPHDIALMKYSWNFGDGKTASGEEVIHAFENAGEYNVILSAEDDQGQIDIDSTIVEVKNVLPEIHIETSIPALDHSTIGTKEDQEITFDASQTTDSLSDVSSLEFVWDFGDGTYGVGAKVEHTYYNEGAYNVKLHVRDHSGGSDSASILVDVQNVDPEIQEFTIDNQLIPEGQTILAFAQGEDSPSDIPRVTYQWAIDNLQSEDQFTIINKELPTDIINVPPKASLIGANMQIESINFKIFGHKWEEMDFLILNEENNTVVNETLIRNPSDPWEVALNVDDLTLSLDHSWRIETYYTPRDSSHWWYFYGHTPVIITIEFSDGSSYEYCHHFNVHCRYSHHQPQLSDKNQWTIQLDPFIQQYPIEWVINYYDPGNDAVTIRLNDDVATETVIPAPAYGPNQGIITLIARLYASSSTPIVLLIEDEDGASSTTSYALDGPVIIDRFNLFVQKMLHLFTYVGEQISPHLENRPLEYTVTITLFYSDSQELTYQMIFGNGIPFEITGPVLDEIIIPEGVFLREVKVHILIHDPENNWSYNILDTITPPRWLGDPIKIIQGSNIQFFAPLITEFTSNIDPSINHGWEDEPIEFEVEVDVFTESNPPLSYYWVFYDGNTAITAEPFVSHTFATEGLYPVEVNVQFEDYTTTRCILIEIQKHKANQGQINSLTIFDEAQFDLNIGLKDDNNEKITGKSPIEIYNVPPKASLIGANMQIESINFKIFGHKWEEMDFLILNEENNTVVNETLVRNPSDPWEVALTVDDLTLSLNHSWRIETYYTPRDSNHWWYFYGHTPVFITIEFSDGSSYEYCHHFNVHCRYSHHQPQLPEKNQWTIQLDPFIHQYPVEWVINYYDPGNDAVTIRLNDDVSTETVIPAPAYGPNQGIIPLMARLYASSSTPIVLSIEDEDGASSTTSYALDGPVIIDRFNLFVQKMLLLFTHVGEQISPLLENCPLEFNVSITLFYSDSQEFTYQMTFGNGLPFEITGPVLDEVSIPEGVFLQEVAIHIHIDVPWFSWAFDINDTITPPRWLGDPIKIIQGSKIQSFAPLITKITSDIDPNINHGWEDEPIEFEVEIDEVTDNDQQLSYYWVFGDGTTLETSTSKVPHAYINEGVYFVEVTVYNNAHSTSKGLIIDIRNKAPIVPQDIELTFEVETGKTVTFDVSSTSDTPSDLGTLEFLWDFGDGDIYSGYSSIVNHIYYQSGNYQATVNIFDDNADTVVLIFEVTVNNPAPKVVLEEIIPGIEGQNVILEPIITGSEYQTSDLVYDWEIGSSHFNQKRISKYFNDGEYPGVLTVTDSEGTFTTVHFTLRIDNRPPTVLSTSHYVYGVKRNDYNFTISAQDVDFDLDSLEYNVQNTIWKSVQKGQIHTQVDLSSLEDGVNQIPIRIRDQTTEGPINFISFTIWGDKDGDNLLDTIEEEIGTNPNSADTDLDSIMDDIEELEGITDSLNEDTDGDGLVDGIDHNTGIGEFTFCTDPADNDTDDDNLLDGIEAFGWEIQVTIQGVTNTIAVISDPLEQDSDNDGLLDNEEFFLGSNPWVTDTDEDGLSDLLERQLGTKLANDDTDNDGLNDGLENQGYGVTWEDIDANLKTRVIYSDPWREDTDDDGIPDKQEYEEGYDASNKDSDNDGLLDNEELVFKTNLLDSDHDNDRLSDGVEVQGWNIVGYDVSGSQYAEEGEVLTEPKVIANERLITTNPLKKDTDGDGLSDYNELTSSDKPSDPTLKDSDGDGISDNSDDAPLITEFKPPSFTKNITIRYEIKAITEIEEILHDLGDIAFSSLALGASVLATVWNDFAADGQIDLPTLYNDVMLGLVKTYVEDNYQDRNWDWNFDTIKVAETFGVNILEFLTDWIEQSPFVKSIIDALFEICGDMAGVITSLAAAIQVHLDDLFDFVQDTWWIPFIGQAACILKIAETIIEMTAEVVTHISSLIIDWFNTYFFTPIINGISYAVTGLGVSITWLYDPVLHIIPIGIASIQVTGSISVIFEELLNIGIKSLELVGKFTAEWIEFVQSIIGILAPSLNIDFQIYDEVGIDYIKLWVNKGSDSSPTKECSYYGSNFADFEWSATEFEGIRNPAEILGIKDYDITILLVDVNGNSRLITKTEKGFVVQFIEAVIAVVEHIIEVIKDVLDYLITGIQRLGEAAIEAAKVVLETAIKIIEAIIEFVQAALEFVWEGIVMTVIQAYKDMFYDPARELLKLALDLGRQTEDYMMNSLFSSLRSETINNSLDAVDTTIQKIGEELEPISDITNSLSNFIGDTLDIFSSVIPGDVKIVIDAIKQLGNLALEIVTKIIGEIINGLLHSILGQILDAINQFINRILGGGFPNLADSLLSTDYFSNLDPSGNTNGLDLFNLLSIFPLITNFLTNIPNVSDLYHSGISGFENFFRSSNILGNFLDGEEGNLFSGYGILVTLLTPVLSIGLAVQSLFALQGGLALDFLGSFLPSSSSTSNELSLSVKKINRLDILSTAKTSSIADDEAVKRVVSVLNWLIMIAGMASEVLGAQKANPGLPDETKLTKSVVMTFVSLVDWVFAFTRTCLITTQLEKEEFDFPILKSSTKFLGNIFRMMRDYASVSPYLSSQPKQQAFVKVFLNCLSSILSLFKLTTVIKDIDLQEDYWFEIFGKGVSIAEDVAKIALYMIKSAVEVFEILGLSELKKGLKTFIGTYESKLRYIFVILDFLEDFALLHASNKVRLDVPLFVLRYDDIEYVRERIREVIEDGIYPPEPV